MPNATSPRAYIVCGASLRVGANLIQNRPLPPVDVYYATFPRVSARLSDCTQIAGETLISSAAYSFRKHA